MEFEKNLNNHEKNRGIFVKIFDETTSSQRTSCRTRKCPTASYLATGEFKFKLFQNAGMVYKRAAVILLPAHPASFAHNFVSWMQFFFQ